MNKSNKELAENLNKGLATIRANGEYQKIYDKWMIK
ncbi:ABC transporter arginine-binding protein [Rodentibacter pneumotropicus]|nr:ABC transporter arginine-binding protein [Rodentibacter pneumotropicus]